MFFVKLDVSSILTEELKSDRIRNQHNPDSDINIIKG